ncbi:hypothetical protein [Bacillus paramycoides]|uniref:hypothetical protein n=1 Tax=Bacillus paramycoides TaxID=2026194 RepID=UPI002E1EFF35|nr:hypothetical protein [Bacillus paramycoides]
MNVAIFIIALCVFLFVVFAIVKMFIAIGKQGDERATFIKNKVMAETFQIAMGLMVLEMMPFIYHRFNETVGTPFNSVRFLAVIAVAFLIILSANKRKYGDS